MKKTLAFIVIAFASACVTSGNHCTTTMCDSTGPNNGLKVETCADATVGIGVASESGSITYGGTKCSWSGSNFEADEEACVEKEAAWCNPTPDMS
jgi:hypothetical protein